MKVILEMFGEPITYGGQESVVYNMLSFLYSENPDYNIDLFTPYYADNKQLIDLLKSHNGNVYFLDIGFKTNDIRYFLYNPVLNFFKKNKRYDVVHIHTGSLATMLVYAMAAKKSGVKKVIVHSHINLLQGGILGKIRKYFICNILKNYVDYFLGCSEEALKAKFTPDIVKKGLVINNGIDIDKFKYNENIRNEYKIPDKFVVGSLGRIDAQKNNLFMVEIIRELVKYDKDIVLMMVGDGNDLQSVKNKINEYNIQDNVILTGRKEDAYKYYQAFDTYIMPSIYEGLPVTAIEAQVSGLPTLLSDKIPVSAKISSGTEFLPIDNPSLWASKILEIKNKHYKRDDFIIDFDKFDRNKTYKKVKVIYDEL